MAKDEIQDKNDEHKLKSYKLRIREKTPKHKPFFRKDNEYYTPCLFVKRFGKFDYDPSTTKEKALEFGIGNYDTIETDGLKADWTKYKRIWINPPFTLKHEFLKKAVETYAQTKADIYILFPVEFITTKRFHEALSGWGGLFMCLMEGSNLKVGLAKKQARQHLGVAF